MDWCRLRSKGFTLVELMVVISIFGLVLAASIPAMGRFLQSWKLGGEIDQFAAALRTARSAAVMKNIDTVFEFDQAKGEYSYFEDEDRDGNKDNGEYRSATMQMSAGIYLDAYSFDNPRIVFGPKGNANESGTVTLRNSHDRTRTISIFGGTGNIRVN